MISGEVKVGCCRAMLILFYDGATKFQKSSPSCELISSLFDFCQKPKSHFFLMEKGRKGERKTTHTTVGGGLRALCIF